MNLNDFPGLLQAARSQPEPQRLLFVFASIGLSAEVFEGVCTDVAPPRRR